MSEKILFTDLDGTLLNSAKKVSPGMQLLLSKWCYQATVWYSPPAVPCQVF